MEITEVRMTLRDEPKLKAYANVTFDDCFLVRHIRVIKTESGYLISMPSRVMNDGSHKDVAHPLNKEFREKLERAVMEKFHHLNNRLDTSTLTNQI